MKPLKAILKVQRAYLVSINDTPIGTFAETARMAGMVELKDSVGSTLVVDMPDNFSTMFSDLFGQQRVTDVIKLSPSLLALLPPQSEELTL